MRQAFETALDFAKKDARNGPFPIIGHQAVSDLLCDSKAKIEAVSLSSRGFDALVLIVQSRALVWRALDDLDNKRSGERALLAKSKLPDSTTGSALTSISLCG